jgi:hypothetical protein
VTCIKDDVHGRGERGRQPRSRGDDVRRSTEWSVSEVLRGRYVSGGQVVAGGDARGAFEASGLVLKAPLRALNVLKGTFETSAMSRRGPSDFGNTSEILSEAFMHPDRCHTGPRSTSDVCGQAERRVLGERKVE